MDPGNGSLQTTNAYLGQEILLGPGMGSPVGSVTLKGNYYAVDFSDNVTPGGKPIQADVCPAIANDCSNLVTGVTPYYVDNIICATDNQTSQRLTCGSQFSTRDATLAATITETQGATQCLIHNNGTTGQDVINIGTPVTINGGSRNPNPSLRGVDNISRSDSVVTVPVFTWNGDPCASPGPGGVCATVTTIGFLQLGIRGVVASGNLDAVVINAVGCEAGLPASPTLTGGALSPIPVRLVQ
jgi:hypothetical protein